MNNKTKNIAFITHARAPYRFRQLETFAEKGNFRINFFYTAGRKSDRNWIINTAESFNEYMLSNVRHYFKVLENDIIILSSFSSIKNILLALLCTLKNKSYVFLMDGISPIKIKNKENILKLIIKKTVVRPAKACFANGTVSREYLVKKIGYYPDRIFNQLLTVDVDKIKIVKPLNESKKEDKVIIYSGRFMKRKNIDHLITAVSRSRYSIKLLLIGDGDEEETLLDILKQKKLKYEHIKFIEKQEDLFKQYYNADCLVLPSYDEPWGLVVNEAMAAGLPVIVSDECGCSMDLIDPGKNGYVFKAGDVEELTEKIDLVFYNQLDKKNSSKDIINNWTFDNSYNSFCRMLKECSLIK